MKAYTDEKQSKKLAEILPIESADMHYSKDFDGSWFVDLGEYISIKIPKYVRNIEEHLLPCWSLAALLEDVLPLGTETHNITDGNKMYYYVEIYTKEIYRKLRRINKPEICLSSERHENLVDACVEMILKLKEKDLL